MIKLLLYIVIGAVLYQIMIDTKEEIRDLMEKCPDTAKLAVILIVVLIWPVLIGVIAGHLLYVIVKRLFG